MKLLREVCMCWIVNELELSKLWTTKPSAFHLYCVRSFVGIFLQNNSLSLQLPFHIPIYFVPLTVSILRRALCCIRPDLTKKILCISLFDNRNLLHITLKFKIWLWIAQFKLFQCHFGDQFEYSCTKVIGSRFSEKGKCLEHFGVYVRSPHQCEAYSIYILGVISIATYVILELHSFYYQRIESKLEFITKLLFHQMDNCAEIK